MPAGRTIVSDCNSESKNAPSIFDSFLKPPSMERPSYKKTYDFVDKTTELLIPNECLFITSC